MAVTVVCDGYLIIPQNMDCFQEGTMVYCYKETFTNRLYLTNKRITDEEMFFKTKIENRCVHISSDAIKLLNSNENHFMLVSMTAKDGVGKTKLYLYPYKDK